MDESYTTLPLIRETCDGLKPGLSVVITLILIAMKNARDKSRSSRFRYCRDGESKTPPELKPRIHQKTIRTSNANKTVPAALVTKPSERKDRTREKHA